MHQRSLHRAKLAGLLGFALLGPGFLSGQAPPSAREGINLGTFNTAPIQPSRSALNTSVSAEPGRPLGTPLNDYKEQYHWSDSDLVYMSSTRAVRLSARVSAGWWYDDNITLSNGGAQTPKVADSYFNLRPSLDLSLTPPGSGLTATITYDMDFQWYLHQGSDDVFNQHVGLNFNFDQGQGGKLRWYLNTNYSSIDGGNVDIGDRVQQNVANLYAGVQYDMTGKLTLGLGTSIALMDYAGHFFPSNNFNGSAYFDYAVTAKTKLGLGTSYAYTAVNGGTNFEDYQLNLRFSWAPTSRLSFNSTVGAMYLESVDGDFSDTTPVATLDLNYDIFGTGKTSATLAFNRSLQPSAVLANQSYFSNDVVLNFTQHVTERTQASLALGYEFAEYRATAANVTATRRDNFFYIRPNLTYAISRSLSSSLFYQLSKDDSTGNGASSFERNSAGVMLNYAF
jgi:hypothetical protein